MTDAPDLRPRPGSGGEDVGGLPHGEPRDAAVRGQLVDGAATPRPSTSAPSAGAPSAGAPSAEPPSTARPVPQGPASSRPLTVPTATPIRSTAAPAAPVAVAIPTAPRGRRRAKLAVASVDPWSVFRFTLVFSVTLLIVWVVVAGVLWSLLNGMHVFDSLTTLINDTFLSTKPRTADELFNFKRTIVWAAGFGVLNAILFTALGTLGAFIYNLCARIVGGIEVTLSDRG